MDMDEGAQRGDEAGRPERREPSSSIIMDISPEEAVLWDEIVAQRGGSLE